MSERRLSKKQKLFVEYYLQTWNATQAAIKAGYSKKSAAVTGHNNITKTNIAEEIKRRVDEICMSSDEALTLLSDQARGTLEDCMDVEMVESRLKKGVMIPSYSINLVKAKEKGKLHLIKSIAPSAYGIKVELHSSQRALELIGKAHGLFIDNIKHEVIKPVIVEYVNIHDEQDEELDGGK